MTDVNESSKHVTTKTSQKSFTTNPWTTCTGLKASKLKHAASWGLAGRPRSQTQRSSVGMFWVQCERQSRIRLGETAQPRVTLGWKLSLYLWTCLNHSSAICQSIIHRVGTCWNHVASFWKLLKIPLHLLRTGKVIFAAEWLDTPSPWSGPPKPWLQGISVELVTSIALKQWVYFSSFHIST